MRPNFHESANAIFIHPFNHGLEIHRQRDLFGDALAQFFGIGRMRLAIAIGITGNALRRHRFIGQELFEFRHHGIHQWRMKGRGNGQPGYVQPSGGEAAVRLFNGIGRAGNHRLLWTVMVGNHNRQSPLFQQQFHGGCVFTNRQHSGGHTGSLSHQLATLTCDFEHRFQTNSARSIQRSDFTKAMAARGVGLQSQLSKYSQQSCACGADSRLRVFRLR